MNEKFLTGQAVNSSSRRINKLTLLKPILKNLRDPTVKKFIQNLLIKGYGNYSIPKEIPLKIVRILEENYKNSNIAIKKAYDEIPELKNKNSIFWKGRKRYSLGKYRHYEMFRFIKKWINGGIILEVGCGENYLGSIIVKKRPTIIKFIGTDVYIHKNIATNRNLEFRKQSRPLQIPVDNKSIDTLLLIDMIHHVDRAQQKRFLQKCLSKLKGKGRIIMIEFTFAEREKPSYEKRIAAKFKTLSKKQKFMVMALLDWIANSLIIGREINMPYSYRTMEEWKQIFKKLKVQSIKSEYLGFLTKLFHPGPYSLFILEKQ